MQRKELEEKIHKVIEESPMWDDISQGCTTGKCVKFSTQLYNLLNRPENAIEGLSVAVVGNLNFMTNHKWLLVHHPDIGHLMVDPTISQYVQEAKTHKPYKGVFIGTYSELEQQVTSPQYEFRYDPLAKDKQSVTYGVWSPAICFHSDTGHDEMTLTRYYKPQEIKPVWKKYQFRIDEKKHDPSHELIEDLGRFAARLEEAGVNWKKVLLTNPHQLCWGGKNPEILFKRIEMARNKHIDLGDDRDGVPFTEKLANYRAQPEETKKR